MDSGISAGMHLGWQFNSKWSTELSYTDLGTSGNSHYNWPESSIWNAGDLKQNYSIKSKAVDLSAKYVSFIISLEYLQRLALNYV